MQSVLIIYCYIILCKVALLFTALYAKCPYYLLLYNMQSVRVIYCFISKVSLLFTALYALYAKCPYYLLLYLQNSLLFTDLYAKCPCYLLLYMQSVLIFYGFLFLSIYTICHSAAGAFPPAVAACTRSYYRLKRAGNPVHP